MGANYGKAVSRRATRISGLLVGAIGVGVLALAIHTAINAPPKYTEDNFVAIMVSGLAAALAQRLAVIVFAVLCLIRKDWIGASLWGATLLSFWIGLRFGLTGVEQLVAYPIARGANLIRGALGRSALSILGFLLLTGYLVLFVVSLFLEGRFFRFGEMSVDLSQLFIWVAGTDICLFGAHLLLFSEEEAPAKS